MAEVAFTDPIVVGFSPTRYITAASITEQIPSAVQEGDLLIACHMGRSAVTVPSGWTQVDQQSFQGGTSTQLNTILRKTATSSDASANLTINTSSSGRCSLTILAIRADQALDDFTTFERTGITGGVTAMPSTEGTQTKALSVSFFSTIFASTTTPTNTCTVSPSSWNQITPTTSNDTSDQIRTGVAHRQIGSSTVSGNWTLNITRTDDTAAVINLVIQSTDTPTGAEIIESGEGLLLTIAQQTAITRSGTLLSIEQAVDLRLSGSGNLLAFSQSVITQAQGQLLTIGQRIRAPFVPTEVVREYEFEVYIDGQFIESCNLAGQIIINREENSSALAEITLQPKTGLQSLEAYHGKSVSIQAVYPDRSVPLFSGTVDIPEFDIMGQRITLRCTDGRTERNNAQSTAFVQSIGRWSSAIFRDPEDKAQEIEDRLTTVAMSLDYDANGQQRLTSWTPKSTPDFVLQDCDVYRREPRVDVAARGRIVNTIQMDFQYRYPRLRKQLERYSWRHPIAGGVCNWYLAGSPPLVEKSTAYAAIGLEWTPTLNEVRDIPPDGFYRCCAGIDPVGGGQSCGYIVFSTVKCTSSSTAELDGFGNQILDANGNPKTKTTQTCIGTGLRYASAINTTKQKRFIQTVTENLDLRLVAPASIQQFGAVKQELSYGYESDIDVSAWEDDKVRSPRIQAGNTDNLTLSQYVNAVQTAQAVAKHRILGSHRQTTVSFQTQFRPEIGLHHTVEVDTRKIKSKGKVQRVRHVYDCTDKFADTEIVTVHSRAITQNPDSPLSLPMRPNNSYQDRQIDINIRYQRDRIEVNEPAVPDEDRNNVELTQSAQTYLINIPNDPLEVFFDE